MSDVDELVILTSAEAYLVVHALAVFERLLRQGALTPEQLHLVAGGPDVIAGDQADVEMAEVVAEAAAPLRRQL
jgi:hypothetical protein